MIVVFGPDFREWGELVESDSFLCRILDGGLECVGPAPGNLPQESWQVTLHGKEVMSPGRGWSDYHLVPLGELGKGGMNPATG